MDSARAQINEDQGTMVDRDHGQMGRTVENPFLLPSAEPVLRMDAKMRI